MARLEVDGVSKQFGDTAILKSINLDIANEEFVSLVGPSGCGKSTLLRIISGLESQTSGTIRLNGQDVSAVKPRDRDLAMVFQSYALYPHLTVEQNIAVPLTMRRLNTIERLPFLGKLYPGAAARMRDIDSEVARVCASLSIESLKQRRPAALSGGQRQRVALARAMVRNPSAFLMDEPLSNLDAKMRVQARSEIAQLHRALGATFVYVTHDQAEAMTMSDRIAVMMDGELLQVGSPDEIYNRPTDLRVAEFIGSPRINRVDAVLLDDGRLLPRTPAIAAAPSSGLTVHMAFRPETARLVAPGDGSFSGTIQHIENLGADIFVHVLTKSAQELIVRLEPGQPRPALHDSVSIGIDHSHVHLFGADYRRVPQPFDLGVAA
ncbi:ABC transporter ATP-binding protein [Rhizobium sp. 22-785-1]